MAKTLLTTPIIQPCLRAIALMAAKLMGWKMASPPPPFKKAIFVGAPHTSNWDFMVMLMGILIWRLDMRWIAKHTLFNGVMGIVMRWLGGIGINRASSQNFVEQMVQYFNDNDELLLVIAPEGTRSPVAKWKSGFYFMAKGADVPIVLVALDYQHKEVRVLEVAKAGDNVHDDIERFQSLYSHIRGKIPENCADYQAH